MSFRTLRFLTFFFTSFAVLAMARAEQVVFSELMYQPPAGKPEFIEVWNITNTPIDIAKWRFINGVSYTFPDFNAATPQAHFLGPQERILVSSADAATTRAAYPGIPVSVRIFGPWATPGALANDGERVTLQDKNGVVVCTVEYQDSGRWPVIADGTGHSLVLADENKAVDDWRVWRASTNQGGSPGVADPALPAAGLALNEFKFRSSNGRVEWVELRNNSRTTSLAASAFFIASKRDFSDKVALSGSLTPGAVASFTVDFAPDNNGDIELYLIDASNNVRDAVRKRRVTGRDAWQVFPPGSREWYGVVADTRDAQNNPARTTDVVINEIMADPPSNERDGEFIELFNKGAAPVDLSGWRLDSAVNYIFPAGTVLAPGSYLVVGANAAYLNANYAGLAAIGNWSGSLGNQGDLIRLEDAHGNLADEVDYKIGGQWPTLAAGDGSSLELSHPDADNAVGTSWRDSDESNKSTFQTYTINGGTYSDTTRGGVNDDEILMWAVSDAHLILRNIVLRPTAGGANLLTNPNVTTLNNNNLDGWQSRGTHHASYHDAEGVHLVASGHGDNKANHMEKDASSMAAGTAYTLQFEGRWVSGKPRIIAQTWDSTWGGGVLLPIPANLGTPGAVNSRLLPAPAPEISTGRHTPAVPTTSQIVTITAQVTSANPLATVQLFHRLDNINSNAAWATLPMNDAGTGGDALAGDSIYTVQVNPTSFTGYNNNGAIVQFYVRATASNGQTTDFPREGAAAPGMWVVDNQIAGTDLRRMRIIISAYWGDALSQDSGTGGHTAKFNFKFPRHSNHYFPCVFIHNDTDVYYNATVRKTGSPYTRQTDNNLSRGRITLPDDNLFRGKKRMYWDNDGSGGSMLHNRIARYWLYLLGVPGNQNEVCRISKNNGSYNVRETSEVFDKDMLNRIWEDGSDGLFYEIDDRHWIGDDGATRLASEDGSWAYKGTDSLGVENFTRYHSQFIPKSRETENDFGNFIEWCRQLQNFGASLTREQLERMADTQAMTAYAAVRGYIGDWDNLTLRRGKNSYFYNRSTDHKWMLIHWDSDLAFQNANEHVLGNNADGSNGLTNVVTYFNRPYIRRYLHYYLTEMIGKLAPNGSRITAWINAEENASPSYNVPATYVNWHTNRLNTIQNFIGTTNLNATFQITTPGEGFTTSANTISISGTAPATAYEVVCIGQQQAVLSWTGSATTDTSPWSLTGLRLKNGSNVLTFRMLRADGTQLGSDITRTIVKTGNAPPIVQATVDPASQNVALGQAVLIQAGTSFDPEGDPLAFQFTVSPATGFTMTSPTADSRQIIFTRPGSYTVTIQATDGVPQSATVQRALSVFDTSDFDSFSSRTLSGLTVEGITVRQNAPRNPWYSLNEETGQITVQITDESTLPLSNSAPAFPRFTRSLPANGDFAIQTNFEIEGRQFGAFITGLLLDTVEGGIVQRYVLCLDSGTTLRVYRASGPTGPFSTLSSTAFNGGETTLRIERVGNTLNFQRRLNGAWTTLHSRSLGSTPSITRGGLLAATGNLNGTPTAAAAQSFKVGFDYLLVSDPAKTNDLLSNLRITELMYNPAGSGGVEFVELQNIGAQPIDLAGVYFEDGNPFSTQFTFPALTLNPGQYVVVTNNITAFQALYGSSVLIAGQYTGSLNNDGERIVLRDPAGNTIIDFVYDDVAPWPTAADGGGKSLEALTTDPTGYANAANWRASQENGGSPGYIGYATDTDGDGLPDAYEQGWGRYEVVLGSFTFEQARADAAARGGHLATITSAAELAAIQTVLGAAAQAPALWLGGTDAGQEGTFRWLTGEAFSFTNWAPSQPDNDPFFNGENFIEKNAGAWTWADVDANSGAGGVGNGGYLLERGFFTNPMLADTDGDTFSDGIEVTRGTNPLLAADFPIPAGITTHPQSTNANVGGSVTFSVVATGNPLNYQWRKNGEAIPGQTSATLVLNNIQSGDAGSYVVVVSNYAGSVESNAATLVINELPIIVTQPLSQTVNPGSGVTFTVVATGTEPFTYVWRKNSQPIAGAGQSSYTITAATEGDQADYDVLVGNVAGITPSHIAELIVNDPPQITAHPQSISVNPGAPFTLSVAATGTAPLAYEWRRNGQLLGAFTGDTITIPSAAESDQGTYTVTVTNMAGSAPANAAVVSVNDPVQVVNPPQSQTVYAQSSVTFSVSYTGTGPFTYQWRRNLEPIPLATNETYTIPNVQEIHAGSYDVVITNVVGPITSASAQLTVNPVLSITQEPQSQQVNEDAAAAFSTVAVGAGTISYQWQKNGEDLPGKTEPTLTIAAAALEDAGIYRCRVSNAFATQLTAAVTLTVRAKPRITQQPVSYHALQGGSATFTVLATGHAPLSYQWFRDGEPVAVGTSATMSIPSVTAAQIGDYTVRITNSVGEVTSEVAELRFLNWPLEAGNYQHLLTHNSAAHPSEPTYTGRISLVVNKTGSFTGKLEYQSRAFPLSGRFDINLRFEKIILRKGGLLPVTVRLRVLGAQNVVEAETRHQRGDGTVYFSTARLPLSPYHPKFQPASQAGRYTAVLAAASGSPSAPATLTARVATSGVASFAGRLPDGTAWSSTARIHPGGTAAIYRALYPSATAGHLALPVNLDAQVGGTGEWLKPAQLRGIYYPMGFRLDMEAAGSRYTVPARNQRALSLTSDAMRFSIEAPFPGAPFVRTLHMSVANTITFDAPNSEKLSLRLDKATGAVRGTIFDATLRKTRKLEGILDQAGGIMRGYYLDATTAGAWRVEE